MVEQIPFEIDGDLLLINNNHLGGDDEVVIAQSGGLTINGQIIELDGKDQELLCQFFSHSVLLETKASHCSHLEILDERASAFSRAAVKMAINSFSGEEGDNAEILADLNRNRSELDRELEDYSPGSRDNELGELFSRWRDFASQIQEQIPEIAQLAPFVEG